MRRVIAGLLVLAAVVVSPSAFAWGPEGHRVIALIAWHYLTPETRQKVSAILATDRSPLTAHDIADEAVWADAYRESSRARRRATGLWHFVDLEIHRPNMRWACWRYPGLAPGVPASQGPARDCVVDKINQFERELRAPATAPHERLLALKFLLHLVGDLHQPLHASDDHDHGGNDKRVILNGHRPKSLHAYWDSTFVAMLNPDAEVLARQLTDDITPAQVARWQRGTPTDWAWQSWRLARDDAYGQLPPRGAGGLYHLNASYAAMAKSVVALQLQRAGVRLAWLLNK